MSRALRGSGRDPDWRSRHRPILHALPPPFRMCRAALIAALLTAPTPLWAQQRATVIPDSTVRAIITERVDAKLTAAHARRRSGLPGQDIGLGSNRRAVPGGDTIVSKNGTTRGYRTIVGYHRGAPHRRGRSRELEDEHGRHRVAPELPLAPPTLPSWLGSRR